VSGTIVATSDGGTSWSTQTSGTTNTLLAVACVGSGGGAACWAVGASGTIVTTSNGGTTWSSQTSPTTNQLDGVAFANGGRGWAVDSLGGIYSYVAPCSAGGLSLTAPGSVSLPALTLSGADQTLSTTVGLTTDDENGLGWNLSATSTTFTNGSATLPTTATTITSGSASAASGNCSLPTNSVVFPVTLPAGSTPPASAKLFNAAVNSGAGPTTVTLGVRVAIPASARTGSYSSTWTFTLASGP
jgi:hypothetical protein